MQGKFPHRNFACSIKEVSILKNSEKEGSPSKLSDEIAELKRISKEELLFRQKAEKLAEELNQEKERRHGFT